MSPFSTRIIRATRPLILILCALWYGLKTYSIIREAAADGEVENCTAWMGKLKDLRGFFTHNAAPYIAVDITESSNPELIIMRENIINIAEADREKYIRLSEISEIIQGFMEAKTILQDHLIKLLTEYNCRMPRGG